MQSRGCTWSRLATHEDDPYPSLAAAWRDLSSEPDDVLDELDSTTVLTAWVPVLMDTEKVRQGLKLVLWAIVSLVSHALTWIVMAGLGLGSFLLVERVVLEEAFLFVKLGLSLFIFQFVLCIVTALSIRVLMWTISADRGYPMISIRGIIFYALSRLHEMCCMVCLNAFKSQPFILWYYRLCGARIGLGVVLNSLNIDPCKFVTIGRGTFVGGDTKIIAHTFRKEGVMFRDVKIGRGCALGMGCVVTRGSEIGDNAVLRSGTSVYGEKLEGGRKYAGSPATLVEEGLPQARVVYTPESP